MSTLGKCVVIAGGPWQKPLVEYLKSHGEYVCVVNPIKTDTTSIADCHIVADVNDLDMINKSIGVKPRFITSDQSDISTMVVAKLCTHWSLSGNRVDVIDRFTNKYVMYEFAKSIGVPVPWTVLAGTKSVSRADLPVVVKPADATNSRGFRVVNDLCELEAACAVARGFSPSGQVLVQEFLHGKIQITLDGVCSGGHHKTLATSRKGSYFKPGLTSFVRYPSYVEPKLLERIVFDNDRYVESAGLDYGLTHGEYIVDGGNYWLVEIAARGAGAGITDKVIPWVTGIHPYNLLYRSLLGEKVVVQSQDVLFRPAVLQFYDDEQMGNFRTDHLEIIKKIPGVLAFNFDFRGQQYSSDSYNCRHTMGIYVADSEPELDRLISHVQTYL